MASTTSMEERKQALWRCACICHNNIVGLDILTYIFLGESYDSNQFDLTRSLSSHSKVFLSFFATNDILLTTCLQLYCLFHISTIIIYASIHVCMYVCIHITCISLK